MVARGSLFGLVLAGLVLVGCNAPPRGNGAEFAPEYLGIETRLMDGELVNFQVAMRGARDNADVADYARCAAARYSLIRGYGFARHVRTNVRREGGIWRGDAVYTISSALPRGALTIDAEVTVADCEEQGIPTV
ncbi:hypothetical protein [Alkalilacustris brevis]|uniref:hypothetical protein n=1 Tax=Alkalilacustris brevis TaxID=2026338 RepID=UPI000E0D2832|nr:hypothetical protein [Alkalilacustris brevis]